MINIELTGWNILYGPYRFNTPFDDAKEDYEIHIGSSIYRQVTPFHEETADWNSDGDIYTQYGAWFRGDDGGHDFFTPQQMVFCIAEGDFAVPGINDPKAKVKAFIEEHPVEVMDRGKRKHLFNINLKEEHFRIEMASGREWNQTSEFEKTSLDSVGKGSSRHEVIGAWFESYGDAGWTSRFYAVQELAQMVADQQAIIQGELGAIESIRIEEKTRGKHRERGR